ncbi:hypothetical protein AAFF_G00146900 [Aldrovandia affinis]|uniref:Uncharacterized protein n=1 Tax=Aldrovandia affinis TaxID=143900 RepID=A0AAD7RQ31_9TELE|nr:hypothetical protein AAFF_G00146900 [Aldrovandia affinis]
MVCLPVVIDRYILGLAPHSATLIQPQRECTVVILPVHQNVPQLRLPGMFAALSREAMRARREGSRDGHTVRSRAQFGGQTEVQRRPGHALWHTTWTQVMMRGISGSGKSVSPHPQNGPFQEDDKSVCLYGRRLRARS